MFFDGLCYPSQFQCSEKVYPSFVSPSELHTQCANPSKLQLSESWLIWFFFLNWKRGEGHEAPLGTETTQGARRAGGKQPAKNLIRPKIIEGPPMGVILQNPMVHPPLTLYLPVHLHLWVLSPHFLSLVFPLLCLTFLFWVKFRPSCLISRPHHPGSIHGGHPGGSLLSILLLHRVRAKRDRTLSSFPWLEYNF